MEAKAVEKYLRISPRKIKFVMDIVRKKPVEEAIGILSLTPKKAAVLVRKAIQSAVANAMENFKEYKVSEDNLYIKEIYVCEGPTLKRFKPRARGRADRVLKRTSHITVLVSDDKSLKEKLKKKSEEDIVKESVKKQPKTDSKDKKSISVNSIDDKKDITSTKNEKIGKVVNNLKDEKAVEKEAKD